MTPLAFLKIAASTLGGALGGAYVEWAKRRPRRRAFYEMAKRRADETGRPLLVVGDPEGGWTHGDYGYGDMCVDLTGCPKAPAGVISASVDLSTGTIPAADDSHVVFVCYVLECVPNIEHALEELLRVAGSPDNLFVLALDHKEVAAWMYPGCQWVVTVDPQTNEISWVPIERRRSIHARAVARGFM